MSIDDLFAGGSKSAFNRESKPGDTVSGTIVSAVERQMTDFATKAPLYWDDGNPRQQVVVTVATDQRVDADDDGQRSIYIKTWGLDKQAFVAAIGAAGFTKASEALAPGNIFTASFTGTQPSKFGSDQKLYEYTIRKGAHVGSAFDQPPAAAAPAAQSDPWGAQGSPAQQPPQSAPAPAAAAPKPANPQEMIAAGWTDEQISEATGATPDVVKMLRGYVPTP